LFNDMLQFGALYRKKSVMRVHKLHVARGYISSRWLPHIYAFIRTEQFGGLILLLAAIAALIWINSPWKESYSHLWETNITINLGVISIHEHLRELVNSGLMTIFFFVVGMEIKRELTHGELSTIRKAAVPAIGALGGMIVPAAIFTAFNATGDGARGWAIPMATDIAFALGVLALLGKSLPNQLRVFLLALAIVDDIGAIVIIAVLFTDNLNFGALGWALAMLGVLIFLSRAVGIQNTLLYWILGAFIWVAVLESGVHATIAGVALGLLTPTQPLPGWKILRLPIKRLLGQSEQANEIHDQDAVGPVSDAIPTLPQKTRSPLKRLEKQVHPLSSFLILPIFALANAGIVLSNDIIRDAMSSPVTLGVLVALPLGKMVGISTFTWIAVRTKMCTMPKQVTWPHIIGVALLGGIGFTVSIFISDLAFDVEALTSSAKIGVLLGSVLSGAMGYVFLRAVSRKSDQPPFDGTKVLDDLL
jgi:NhaA family Na+:H+ antiporter